MIIHASNILALPIFLIASVLNCYVCLVGLRFLFSQIRTARASPDFAAIELLTNALPRLLAPYIAKRVGTYPAWLPVGCVVAALLIQQVLTWVLVGR